MNPLPHRLPERVVRRLSRTLFAIVLCALVPGCVKMPRIYPEVPRRSLTELYHEAVAASLNSPERNGALVSGFRTVESPVASEPFLPPATSAHGSPLSPVPAAEESYTPEASPASTVPLLPPAEPPPPGINTGWRAGGQKLKVIQADNADTVLPVSHSSSEPITAVTELFEDNDVREALQSLATQANVTVIIDEQVGGVVSAVIEEEPFESALRKVLLPLGLVWKRTDQGEYLIGIPDPESPLFGKISERLEYRPLHLSPEELGALIPERDQKFLQLVDARNRILIEAPEEIAQRLFARLQELDTPIPQVELEAIVCVVAPDSGFKSGLDWNHAVSLNGSEVFNFGLAGLALGAKGSGAGVNNAFSNFSVTSAFVRLLAQEGYLAIRAAPRVTARDGDQARISITRESYFSTQPQSDQVFFRQEIKQVDAGIELDITPIIRGDNITVKIEKAEVSEDIRTSSLSSAITDNPFPKINRRTVSTTVHVKDGETVVIGGLVQRQVVDRIARIPVIGHVPGMGRMFQTVEQSEQDAEVVIFISPRLVHPSSEHSMPSNVGAHSAEVGVSPHIHGSSP